MATVKARVGGAWVEVPINGAVRFGGVYLPFGSTPPPTGQSLFTDADLAGANTDFLDSGGGPLTLGTVLRPSVPGQVTKGRWRFPDTDTGSSVKFVLYDYATEARLAEATFVAPTWGAWNEVDLPVPASLVATQDVVACVYQSTANPRYITDPGFFTAGKVSGVLSAPASSEIPNGRFTMSDTFPTGSFGSTCYFPDIVFIPD